MGPNVQNHLVVVGLKFQVQVEIGIEKFGMVMPLDGSNNKVTVQWK